MLEQMIKDMDLIDNDYIQKKTKCDRSHINKKIRKIRLLMFLDGYIVPEGYISKAYFKLYFRGSILWKNYDPKKIDTLKKMGV